MGGRCEMKCQHRYLDLRRNAAQSLRELMTLEVKEEEEEQEATDQVSRITKVLVGGGVRINICVRWW